MKIIKTSLIVIMLFMLTSCSITNEYERELTEADKALLEADLIDVNISTDVSVTMDGRTNSQKEDVSMLMSVDPFFAYIEGPENAILYEEQGNYYQATLSSPLTEDEQYAIIPQLIEIDFVENLSGINLEEDIIYQFIDAHIEKSDDHVYEITTTFENLLDDPSFEDLYILKNIMTNEQYEEFASTEVSFTIDFNEGIKVSFDFLIRIDYIIIDFASTMDVKTVEGSAIDERFLMLESNDISKATELIVDQSIILPQNQLITIRITYLPTF